MDASSSLSRDRAEEQLAVFPKNPAAVYSPYGAGYAQAGAQANAVDLGHVLGVLRRRKLIILITAALITSAVALLAFRLTPLYTATAEVLIKPGESQFIDVLNALHHT